MFVNFKLTAVAAVLLITAEASTTHYTSIVQDQLDFYARYDQLLDMNKFQDDQPVIGIMTMPFWDHDMKTEDFQYDHFSWEHNINFVHYGGSHAIPIRYDLPDEELYALLDQINGVFFTGGGIIDML